MQTLKKRPALFLILIFALLLTSACGTQSVATDSAIQTVLPAAPIASDDAMNEGAIRFLENKLKSDPEDFSANNKLAGLYLQKLRETGNASYLDLTFRAARASLASVSEVRNAGGHAALAQAELAAHEFVSAKEHALRLIELEPTKSYPQGILGDALLELGEYDKAEVAYKKITLPDGGARHSSETRFARLAQLRGDNASAQKHLANALTFALNLPAPARETVAWIRWQLGETAFSVGNYATAEKHYNRQLALFYADHDIKSIEAYNLAAKEYETRRDIYGADALAWTALKANKLAEAQAAMKDALRLETHDARLFYHAGMIAKSANEPKVAQEYLQKALRLNAWFDSLQAKIILKNLEELK
jgi:Flp pilus assembly protein TadD